MSNREITRDDQGSLTCPNCNREARFREVYGPDDSMHLVCSACGAATDDAELALAQEPENGVKQ